MPGQQAGHRGVAVTAAGAGQQRGVAGRREPVLDAAQQGQHGRVVGVGHEHADGERVLGAQGAGQQVGLVAQVGGGPEDPLHGGRADQGLAVRAERARGGAWMHPGRGRDVGQLDAHGPDSLHWTVHWVTHWVMSRRRMARVPMISAAAADAPSTAQSSRNPKLLA